MLGTKLIQILHLVKILKSWNMEKVGQNSAFEGLSSPGHYKYWSQAIYCKANWHTEILRSLLSP